MGELAEMAEGDKGAPQEATGDGRLGWPERRRALIAAAVSAEGLWETHVLPDLSADYFLQNKRHYFRTGNLHFGALPPPLLSVSLPHAHVFCCLGGF